MKSNSVLGAENTVSKTAFYCCGVRMSDYDSETSVLNDKFAGAFMDDASKRFYRSFSSCKRENGSTLARAKIVDDYIVEQLKNHSTLSVISIGAGFDTRAYRVAGGDWFEIDEAAIIDFKNSILPADECKNSLRRFSISFSGGELLKTLEEIKALIPKENDVVVIIEGVLLYLDIPEMESTFNACQKSLGKHTLVCDLMSSVFCSKYGNGLASIMANHGAVFKTHDKPGDIVERSGYEVVSEQSIVETALRIDGKNIPSIVKKVFLKKLVAGYTVNSYRFG